MCERIDRTISLLLVFSCCFGFAEEGFYFETVEEQPPGTLIDTFSILQGTYRISGSDEAKQHIDLLWLLNGTIKVKQRIDREALKTDRLSLAIIDEQTLSITSIKIRVKDINDNSPRFSSPYYNVSLLESVPLGTRISLPSASDPDNGENGTIASYQLQNTSDTFALASPDDNGSVSLYLTSQLDRENISTYELVLTAFDGGQPKKQGQMTIFVNVQDSNEAPRFEEKDYNVTVNADHPSDRPLLRVKAVDVDDGYNGMVHYQIQDDPIGQFSIDNRSGEIFVNHGHLTCRSCLITVEAIDGGTPPLKARKLVRIVVNETSSNLPTIKIRTYPLGFDTAFVHSEAKPETVVAILTSSSSANLSIVSGNEGDWFRLESGDGFGIIRVVQLESVSTRRLYQLVIQTQDKTRPSLTTKETLKLIVYDDASSYKYLDEDTNQTYSICKSGLPCYSGTCSSNGQCECSSKYSGVYCDERIFAFKFGSSLQLKLPEEVTRFSMQFRSVSGNGVLLHSSSSSNTKDYFSIRLINGDLYFDGAESKLLSNSIQIFEYTTLELELGVNGTTLKIGSDSHAINQQIPFKNDIFIGDDPAHRVSNFFGCIKAIKMDGHSVSSILIAKENNLMESCPFDHKYQPCSLPEAQNACQNGRCVDSWEDYYCICGEGFEAMNCLHENLTFSGAQVRLIPSSYSAHKLSSTDDNNKLVRYLDDRLLYSAHNFSQHEGPSSQGEIFDRIDSWPSQWVELDVKTSQSNSLFFTLQSVAGRRAQLKAINGQLHYFLTDSNNDVLASLHLNGSTLINDNKWHRVTVEIASDNRSIRLRADDLYLDSFVNEDFPQFLSSSLEFIEVGSQSFDGCIRRLLVNNQLYPITSLGEELLEKQFLQISSINGTLNSECTNSIFCSPNDCSMEALLHGITTRELIIVTALLILLLLGVYIGFQVRRRFQKRQKLTNVQRIHNLQLISTSSSDYGHENAAYSSNIDFAYFPSYIPIYSNLAYSSSDICSCHFKFDYGERLNPDLHYHGHKFNLTASQECSISSSSSTDIPLDPPNLPTLLNLTSSSSPSSPPSSLNLPSPLNLTSLANPLNLTSLTKREYKY